MPTRSPVPSRATFADLFSVSHPVIAMAHLPPLPGTPRFRRGTSLDELIEPVRRDVQALLDAGVDALMFCNEDDRPYALEVGHEVPATMAAIVAELKPADRPFGVDVLWAPMAAIALARATGASFMREVVTGAYESDMGVWAPDAASLFRYRSAIDADDVLVLANITPEFASPLGGRSVADRAKSAVTSSLVDGILIAGPMAGAAPDLAWIREAKDAVAGQLPVLMNTGATPENVAGFLEVADGVIVGSGLKVDGQTWNPVDRGRASAFVAAVRTVREER
jgi:membrane complex biogenesis BtpA family protein